MKHKTVQIHENKTLNKQTKQKQYGKKRGIKKYCGRSPKPRKDTDNLIQN